jgi:hypothetical protein
MVREVLVPSSRTVVDPAMRDPKMLEWLRRGFEPRWVRFTHVHERAPRQYTGKLYRYFFHIFPPIFGGYAGVPTLEGAIETATGPTTWVRIFLTVKTL